MGKLSSHQTPTLRDDNTTLGYLRRVSLHSNPDSEPETEVILAKEMGDSTDNLGHKSVMEKIEVPENVSPVDVYKMLVLLQQQVTNIPTAVKNLESTVTTVRNSMDELEKDKQTTLTNIMKVEQDLTQVST